MRLFRKQLPPILRIVRTFVRFLEGPGFYGKLLP